MPKLPDHYLHKTVRFKFMGEECTFDLSHGLFSSYDIDQGSKLLLKTIAQQMPTDRIDSILDVGCGVGVLGICVKRKRPQASLLLQDRDALAVAVSAGNCRRNGIRCTADVPGSVSEPDSDTEVRNALALEQIGDRSFDLILSNVPAKAGLPVIEDMLCRAPSFLTDRGRIAVVLVTPLEQPVEEILKKAGMELLHRERTANHVVFHYRGAGTGREQRFPVYLRKTEDFILESLPYTLDTVYNIPDFDHLGFAVQNAGSILRGYQFSGRIVFLNPGQGHVPMFVLGRAARVESVRLAGNDRLALLTSVRNIRKRESVGEAEMLPTPGPFALREAGDPESVSFLWADLQPVPGAVTEWIGELIEAAEYLLEKGGFLSVSGNSSDVFQFARQASGFRIGEDRKFRGFRSLLLKKRS